MSIQPEQFATNSLRRSPMGNDICRVLAAAIHSADAEVMVKNNVLLDSAHLIIGNKNYDLNKFKRIFSIAAGKAAVPMAKALHEILGDRITTGVVITKDGYLGEHNPLLERRVAIIKAGHPIPDQRNLDASTQIISLSRDLNDNDLVVCLFSGGGSALLMNPSSGIYLKDLQVTTELLLKCGATIKEINTVRKHIDKFKGGGLVKALFPASVISLLLSDVVGDDLDMIASGPTVADPTTYMDAWAVLNKYQILDQIPLQVRAYISDGIAGKIPETLKPGDPVLNIVQNILVGNNTQTVIAAIQAANAAGFNTGFLTAPLHGEASQVGQTISDQAKSLLASSVYQAGPACLIAGGETTVTIKGSGKGGRNQELALGAVKSLSGADHIILVSLATDGGDGPTDAAGAVATNQTYSLGLEMGLDPMVYLERNDSYHYFEALGDLIITGPTLTNVNDLVFIFGV